MAKKYIIYLITGNSLEAFYSEEGMIDVHTINKDIETAGHNAKVSFGVYCDGELDQLLMDPETCNIKYDIVTTGPLTNALDSMMKKYGEDLLRLRWEEEGYKMPSQQLKSI